MAPQDNQDPVAATAQPGRNLSRMVSVMSTGDGGMQGLRGRESLVSLQSYRGTSVPAPLDLEPGHTYAGASTWSPPFLSPPGYAAVDRTDDPQPQPNRRKSLLSRPQDTIAEEDSYDLGLLGAAAPVGVSDGSDAKAEDDDALGGPLMDVTTYSGPIGAQDREFLKRMQEQEALGQLTGGLGAGEAPPATRLNGEELLATTPTLKRSFTRALTTRRKKTTKQETIRGLAQSEANKTGKVVEVVIEEASEVDLSSMTGPGSLGAYATQMRQTTLPPSYQESQVLYPQPNWKPFSMRAPYLSLLIVVSILLAITMELVYQKSTREPLMVFHTPDEINPFDYFVLRFVPTLATVIYGVMWQITDGEVKRLEAFYQMSKERGALAAESINVDYITMFNFMRPFRAFQRGHYAVALSSVATILAVSLTPTLSAASIYMTPDRATRLAAANSARLEKTIVINAVFSRLLTSTFIVIALLGCVLFYQLQTRRSGLLADVKGIAGLAAMAVVSHIMMDFRDMDVAKPQDIHAKLKNHRYVLRNSSLAPDRSRPVTSKESDRYKEAHVSENPHPLALRAEGAIPFIAGVVLFVGFIPVVLFTPAADLTERAPWLVTLLAVGIKIGWGALETSIRMMEPYYLLSKRHAPARTLTLDYTAMPFAWFAVRALLNRHWLVFLAGFGTVLAETLTIFVTSLATVAGRDLIEQIRQDAAENGGGAETPLWAGARPKDNALNAGQETTKSFLISLAFTVFILLYMVVVATVIFVRRRHPFLPRQPTTIASVLAFVHQSKMLYDFVGTAKLSNAAMARRLDGLGKTYGLGWFEGRDGQTHCGVDEEELTGSYKHGVDYASTNKPWDREWQTF